MSRAFARAPGDVPDLPLDPPETPFEECPHDPPCEEGEERDCAQRQAQDWQDAYDSAMESKGDARENR